MYTSDIIDILITKLLNTEYYLSLVLTKMKSTLISKLIILSISIFNFLQANQYGTLNNMKWYFSNFSCMFLNPNLNSNCSNLLSMRNVQEQVKKEFCYQNCSDLLWETICSNSERSEQFLVTECFFNLFLEVSLIQ